MTKFKELDSKKAASLSPGDRIRYIRDALIERGRPYLEEKYGISRDTLKSWENRKEPFKEKAVQNILKLLDKEGVLVSEEWIVDGTGPMPQKFSNLTLREPVPVFEKNIPLDDHQLLLQEIQFFQSLSKNSVIFQVISEEMAPWYSINDYVGGRYKHGNQIQQTIGKDCIVKTTDNKIYFRRLFKGTKKDTYHLACLNPMWNQSEPVIYDVHLEFSAPIIWHRRNEG